MAEHFLNTHLRRDRRPQWREAVFAGRPGMTDGTKVLLLFLLDSGKMNRNGIASVPRATLARQLGVAPARISERIALAKQLGYLTTVRRGRPRVTAVYQATLPPPRGAESEDFERYGIRTSEVRPPVSVRGTESVPLAERGEVQIPGSQELVPEEVDRLTRPDADSATAHSMTGRVIDLLAERHKRQQQEMHFATDVEALTFAAHRLEELRRLVDSQPVVSADSLTLPLAQAAAIVRACLRLHRRSPEEKPYPPVSDNR